MRAVQDEKKGMGSFHAEIDEDALEFLADVANGDARSALNAVELGILTTEQNRKTERFILHWMWHRSVSRSV